MTLDPRVPVCIFVFSVYSKSGGGVACSNLWTHQFGNLNPTTKPSIVHIIKISHQYLDTPVSKVVNTQDYLL